MIGVATGRTTWRTKVASFFRQLSKFRQLSQSGSNFCNFSENRQLSWKNTDYCNFKSSSAFCADLGESVRLCGS